jgi:IS5 family transposase
MEVYLRLTFLKFRYRLGYESLRREVSDSITFGRFCRIPLDGKVPHPTTLMKLTTRCGTAAVDDCNEALLAKAAQAKLLRTTRVRDRSRSAGARARAIGAKLRLHTAAGRDDAQAVVRRIAGEMAGLAERAATDTEHLPRIARLALRNAQHTSDRFKAAGQRGGDPVVGRGRLQSFATSIKTKQSSGWSSVMR